MDINLKKLVAVTDVFKDGTTLVRTLEKKWQDMNTASPFSDCKVQLLLKVQVDDNEPLFDNL